MVLSEEERKKRKNEIAARSRRKIVEEEKRKEEEMDKYIAKLLHSVDKLRIEKTKLIKTHRLCPRCLQFMDICACPAA